MCVLFLGTPLRINAAENNISRGKNVVYFAIHYHIDVLLLQKYFDVVLFSWRTLLKLYFHYD